MRKVFVFRTSVLTTAHVDALRPLLQGCLSEEARWNFDLEDREKILRVEGRNIVAGSVIQTIQAAGFTCEELDD